MPRPKAKSREPPCEEHSLSFPIPNGPAAYVIVDGNPLKVYGKVVHETCAMGYIEAKEGDSFKVGWYDKRSVKERTRPAEAYNVVLCADGEEINQVGIRLDWTHWWKPAKSPERFFEIKGAREDYLDADVDNISERGLRFGKLATTDDLSLAEEATDDNSDEGEEGLVRSPLFHEDHKYPGVTMKVEYGNRLTTSKRMCGITDIDPHSLPYAEVILYYRSKETPRPSPAESPATAPLDLMSTLASDSDSNANDKDLEAQLQRLERENQIANVKAKLAAKERKAKKLARKEGKRVKSEVKDESPGAGGTQIAASMGKQAKQLGVIDLTGEA
ncbi:hypothetical protein JCM11641_002675 [Rhodosporidiobolus odoratus]